MTTTTNIQPDQVHIRFDKSNKSVADVHVDPELIDTQVGACAENKLTAARWDSEKTTLRQRAAEVFALAERMNNPVSRVNFFGTANSYIEVAASSQRKALPDKLVQTLGSFGFPMLVQDDVEVVLKGELAKWVLALLKDRVGVDANMKVTERRVLAPEFEQVRRKLRQQDGQADVLLSLLNEVESAGIFAPAVEAKVQKG